MLELSRYCDCLGKTVCDFSYKYLITSVLWAKEYAIFVNYVSCLIEYGLHRLKQVFVVCCSLSNMHDVTQSKNIQKLSMFSICIMHSITDSIFKLASKYEKDYVKICRFGSFGGILICFSIIAYVY